MAGCWRTRCCHNHCVNGDYWIDWVAQNPQCLLGDQRWEEPIKTNKNLHKVVSVTLEHITFIMSMNKASVYGSKVIQHAFEIS